MRWRILIILLPIIFVITRLSDYATLSGSKVSIVGAAVVGAVLFYVIAVRTKQENRQAEYDLKNPTRLAPGGDDRNDMDASTPKRPR